MPNKRNDKNETDMKIDAELDAMLAQWAEADADALGVEVPEGFHENLMAKLRQEQALNGAASQHDTSKKGVIVSLSEQLANKKAWLSAAAAAAVVICCLPMMQGQQNADINLADAQMPANARMIQQESIVNDAQEDGVPQMMMAAFVEEEASAPEGETDSTDTADGTAAYDKTLTPEEQLTQLQKQLEEVQNQLNDLDDIEANQAQRAVLQTELEQLQEAIEQLETQLEIQSEDN